MTRFGLNLSCENDSLRSASRMAFSSLGTSLGSILHNLATVKLQAAAPIFQMTPALPDSPIERAHCRRHGEHDEECMACQQAEIHRRRTAWHQGNNDRWKEKGVDQKQEGDKVMK